MDDANLFERLPVVDELSGAHFSPVDNLVRVQFRSGTKIYEIPIPIDEALKVEELFVKIRRQLGQVLPRRNQSES